MVDEGPSSRLVNPSLAESPSVHDLLSNLLSITSLGSLLLGQQVPEIGNLRPPLPLVRPFVGLGPLLKLGSLDQPLVGTKMTGDHPLGHSAPSCSVLSLHSILQDCWS